MARQIGQIVGRGARAWLVRVYNGRDPETKKRKYSNQTVYGGLREAQTHLNRMLGERDRGRNLDSSKQTLNEFLDRWLELCAKPQLCEDHTDNRCVTARAMLLKRAIAAVPEFRASRAIIAIGVHVAKMPQGYKSLINSSDGWTN